MSNVSPVGSSLAGRAAEGVGHAQGTERARPAPEAPAPARPGDRVEVSRLSVLLSRLWELPEMRQDLISRIRQEIVAGTYEDPDKLEAALNALLEEIDPA